MQGRDLLFDRPPNKFLFITVSCCGRRQEKRGNVRVIYNELNQFLYVQSLRRHIIQTFIAGSVSLHSCNYLNHAYRCILYHSSAVHLVIRTNVSVFTALCNAV